MKALVVGYGRMGGFHAKVLADLGYRVTTVDPDPGRMADHLTLDAAVRHCTPFGSLSAQFDVAAVAVPAQHLLDTAYELAGVPMLVEKPFATNARDARLLAAYLEQSGSQVCVGLVERFNPQARALRALIQDGTLTGITRVVFTRWNDRPTFDLDLDLRLHDIDLAHWLGIPVTPEFDTVARAHQRVRKVTVTHDRGVSTYDLMDHNLSPLHGLWHAFLTDGSYPTPRDAIAALDVLEFVREAGRPLAVAA